MALRQLTPLDSAWLLLESRDTPMHVGALFEFTPPEGDGRAWLAEQFEAMRLAQRIPAPWNLKLVDGPLIGRRLPLMREDRNIDIDYHVRRSALPHPGGQRELGILVSRLHSHQLDLHRPLWEAHVIEGLEGDRFAIYIKMHHSLIDGVGGIKMILRGMTNDPEVRGMEPFWSIGDGAGGSAEGPETEDGDADGSRDSDRDSGSGGGFPLDPAKALGVASSAIGGALGFGKGALKLGRGAIDTGPLQAPYNVPGSVLGSRLGGQRRFATQQYAFDVLKRITEAEGCTLNDLVLYLSSSALRRYLLEHAGLPGAALVSGIPVNVRRPEDEGSGNAVGMMIAELATNVADPRERLEAICASTDEAKSHLEGLPRGGVLPYTLLLNLPYMAGMIAGMGAHSPAPYNLLVSNVPGPSEPRYFNGARLDAIFPLSLLMHGNALNITCLSYAGTLNFGFTGARDSLPHLQKLAIYMGEALEQLCDLVLDEEVEPRARPEAASSANGSGRSRRRSGSSAKSKSST